MGRLNKVYRENLLAFLSRIIVILVCFPIHECAHAWTACRLGDDTAKQQGRITLNPLKHLDLYGTLLLLAIGVGYAKPVPVNYARFKNKKLGMAITALAGPLSNLLMACVFLVFVKLCTMSGFIPNRSFIVQMAASASYINVSLVILNLIPVPPLDGSKILGAVLPDDVYNTLVRRGSKMGLIVILGIFFLNRMGYSPIGRGARAVYHFLYRLIVTGG